MKIAGVAHEIKNPLNFINNFSELSDRSDIDWKRSMTLSKSYEKVVGHGRQRVPKMSTSQKKNL